MKNIGFHFFFTFSKALSLAILVIGTIYAFLFKDGEVIIFSMSLSAGLAGLKTWSAGRIEKSKIESAPAKVKEVVKKEDEIG